jgi:hypothetical protein
MSHPLERHHKDVNYEDEDYFIPLEDQRVFGAGIKRKRIPFVRPAYEDSTFKLTSASSRDSSATQSRATSVADQYLSIVLSKKNPTNIVDAASSASTPLETPPLNDQDTTATTSSHHDSSDTGISTSDAEPIVHPTTQVCEICKLPLFNNSVIATLDEGHRDGRPQR